MPDWLIEVWDALMAPISGATEHFVDPWVSLHGRLMVLAWGIFLPVAIILARFYKVTPRQDWPRELDNPFWFRSHRTVSYSVTLIMTLAAGVALLAQPSEVPGRSFHILAGWTVFVLGWLQTLGSHLRGTMGGPVIGWPRKPRPREQWPGDHYDMTRQRVLFEWIHKILGYLLVVLAIVSLLTGLAVADALVWMWLVLAAWWLACAGAFVVFQRQGRCIDTYQSIWGLSSELIGNRMKPIGWGVRTYTEDTVAAAPYPRRKR
jgi:hypothetical protein